MLAASKMKELAYGRRRAAFRLFIGSAWSACVRAGRQFGVRRSRDAVTVGSPS